MVAQNLLSLAVLALGPWTPSALAGPYRVALCIAGGLLVLAGAVLGIAGVRALGSNRTAFPQPLPGSRLVVTGIYRRVRHPLYTSLIALGFGWSLGWASIPAAGAAILLFLVLRTKARIEERALEMRHPGYEAYRRHTPRFLPALRVTRPEPASHPSSQ